MRPQERGVVPELGGPGAAPTGAIARHDTGCGEDGDPENNQNHTRTGDFGAGIRYQDTTAWREVSARVPAQHARGVRHEVLVP